jgi:RNA methyltransferase, TrmH family
MKLSINQLKFLKSLHLRKFRQKYHNFIVEGTKIASEVLSGAPEAVEGIFAVPEWVEANSALPAGMEEKLTVIDQAELKKISLLSTPNHVLLVVKEPAIRFDKKNVAQDLSLYLEDIRDPGNFGTILRIADWFGIPWVFCSPESVEVFNPKVIQASMGAFLRVKCLPLDFAVLKKELPELPVYGTVLDGAPVFDTQISQNAIIVIGNESRGISPAIEPYLSHRISIPRGNRGGAESLNAAIATGIICAVFRNFRP